MPAFERASGPTYVWYHRAMSQTADRFMPFLVLGGSAAAAVVTALHFHRSGADLSFILLLVGTLGCVSVAPLTIAFNLRINDQMLHADPAAPPEDWEASRAAWNRAHRWRTRTSILGLMCFAAGALHA